jgi:N-carbamoyl-L-amino-acid hydrolase
MMGSAAFAGARDAAEILACHDADGITVEQALRATFAALPELPIGPLGGPVHAYLEPHIEQGVVLEQAGIPLGIVTGLQGKRTFAVTITGEAAHAGTAPRATRRDALLAAARAATALDALTADAADITRFTIGRLDVSPNAPSVVPERVQFSIDLRHPEAAVLTRLGDAIAGTIAAAAAPCTAHTEELSTALPSRFDAAMQDELEALAKTLGLPAMRLLSMAGHDSRFLAPLCPSAMIFIPCLGGVTHHPAESISPADAQAGAMLAAAAMARWSA